MSVAFVFPGQGSQAVGMLASYAGQPEVAQLQQRADQALGEPLSAVIANGPADELALTTWTQPAMLLAGMANLAAWRAAGGPEPDFVAGHSLGEYTALVAAGSLDLETAIRLVRLRAQAMQEAVPVGTGGMAAILGLSDADVMAACESARPVPGTDRLEEVAPVNFNAPSQVVIAGHSGAVQRACEAAQAKGARRAVMLPVSAPFHSVLLQPAGEVLKGALADIELKSPTIPLINNVDVAFETEPDRIRDALVRQAWHPVRWVELIQALADKGVDHFVEFGPGKVLTGLIKRIAPQARLDNVSDAASLQTTLAKFQ
ncbi:MAG: ACP S-malonyltransferase [Lautropia sp.]|nr:ACP S-malonyltransferase [Lautropia sp.]